jgi:Fic/DOC family
MAARYSAFLLEDQPEVFASDATTSVAVHRAVQAGRARRIARGVFTRNTSEPIESVVARNWAAIAAHYAPDGVVVDRSAFEAKPSGDGSLVLDGGPELKARRTHELPGLRLRVRPGPGPLPGDMPYLTGLYFSSRPRAWLDNMAASRARGGVSRTLSRAELERELNRMVAVRGWDAVNELRDQARELAPLLGAEPEFAAFDDLVGALQGTRDAPLRTPGGKATGRGRAFDPDRLDLFGRLHAALLVDQLPRRPEQGDSLPALSFIEAYFSNWIEGTEFELGEAEAIVFERAIPANRVEDAHDILGTFDLVNDDARRRKLPNSADEFIDLLRSHHAAMLERRPQARPGEFKEQENRAGATTFVHPDLVVGTLQEGFRYVDSLPEGLPRAIFLKFLIAEVHPFADGNGRVARVFMNAALTAAGLQRIVIPLVFRDNYLQALRTVTRNREPAPLINVLDFAQRYAAAIPWQTLEHAEAVLRATNAFVRPDEAEEIGARLLLPELAAQLDGGVAGRAARSGAESLTRWASEHLGDLTLIWDRFKADGEWPDARPLARELFGAGRNFDVDRFAQTMPPQLGRFDTSSGRLTLTPRGLSFVEDARALLSNIPKLVSIAIMRYGDPAVAPIISSGEFDRLLGVSEREARQLSELLLVDSWLFRAAGNDNQAKQQFQIDPSAILKVRSVASLDDYFAARDTIN